MIELEKVYNPKAVEDRWYKFWEEKGFFHAEPSGSKKPYCVVIPPPNITGILHMGHALNNTIQDILIRFKRMQNFETLWMPGTDHAGIATQNVVERKLLEKGARRQELGREKFLEEVWKWRDEYGSTIIKQLKKLGCSCDWARTRFTMDEGLSEAVLEAFIRLYDKGLIYKGDYIINWCPRCQTALSDEEAQHKDIEGMLYYIKYPIKKVTSNQKPVTRKKKTQDSSLKTQGYIVVATTRPETMLGDVAIAVNPKDKRYKNLKGETIILPILNRELVVIFDPLVDAKFGTGALKVTPAHDPVDFRLGLKHKLKPINVMNPDATINENGGEFNGMGRFEAREAILEDLKGSKLFVKLEPHRHSVGHCYRCHTMIEPRLSAQWFVRMKPLAKRAIEVVEKGRIKFFPTRWTKVYLSWMENMRDWCVSRQIWWGHRIPVYYCKNCLGQRTENRKQKTEDNAGIIVSKIKPEKCPDCGGTDIEQDPDVLDTWFSSWLWPFSTLGWPKDSPELKYFYPTSSLVTAQEIIFFWVARMIMAGLEFMKDIPFRGIYIHGTVRDDTGTKMSKSLGNIIDPLDMIEKYGTDALRFSIISITAQGQDVFLSESKFERGRNFANKIWNASRFILMNLKAEEIDVDLCAFFKAMKLGLADRWILSRFYATLTAVEKFLESYRFNDAAGAIYEFFWHEFCDWYIEMSKAEIQSKAKQVILYKILEKSLRMLHPFMPFITEEIWQGIPHEGDSIMIQKWPHIQGQMISREAESDMAAVIELVSAVRNMRADWNIDPAMQVDILINAPGKGLQGLLAENLTSIKNLARVGNLTVGEMDKPAGSAAVVLANAIDLFMPLEGLIDARKEASRLSGQLKKIGQEASSISGRLKDKNFLTKAPMEVVEKTRAKLKELKERQGKLEDNLKTLKL